MGAPSYRYLLCDLLTDTPVAVLPLSGVSFEDRLGRAGAFAASLPMANAEGIRLGRLVQQYTGRGALWVYRTDSTGNTALWWGGILWSSTPQADARTGLTLNLSASTFWSYAHHRYLTTFITATAEDQGDLVRRMWRALQVGIFTGPYTSAADIGVKPADTQPHGILRDRAYDATEAITYGQRLEELGDVIDGPESWIRVSADEAGVRRKQLVSSLRIGRTDPVATFTTSPRGGSILSWSEPTDANNAGTTFRARGAAPEGNATAEQKPLMGTRVVAQDLIDRGWPELDVVTDHSDVTVKATLDAYALANLTDRAGQITTSSCTVRVDGTGWAPQALGSNVRLRFSDPWHRPNPEGPPVDRIVRPVAYKATPSDRSGQESVELIYDERGQE